MISMLVLIAGFFSIILAAFLLFRSSVKNTAEEQIKVGLESMSLIKKVIVLSQQHRGLSNAYKKGNDALKPALLSLQSQLDRLIVQGNNKNLTDFPQWESYVDYWPRLKSYVNNDNKHSQNIVRQHNIMIDSHLSLFDEVTRYYKLNALMLDNVTRVSELCLDTLRTSEIVGQARAVGAGICVKGSSKGIDAITLNFLRLSLESSINELCKSLPMIKNTELSHSLTVSANKVSQKSQELITIIENQLLIDGVVTFDSKQYFDLATSSIDELLIIFNSVESYSLNNFTAEN